MMNTFCVETKSYLASLLRITILLLVHRGEKSKDRQFSYNARIKILVNTDISVIEFYGNIENIGNIGKISVDIFTQISVIKIFHILII